MSEGILRRWSRRKLEAAAQAALPACEPDESRGDQPLELPAIDTLGPDSDYGAFLARAVPEELQRLALRKAWSTDPKIAAFRGFAEYDWDCNAAGYGALLPIDDIARLCDAVLRPPAPVAAVPPGEPSGDEPADAAETAEPDVPCPTV